MQNDIMILLVLSRGEKMAKANYVTVGRKPKNGKTPKVQEAFRLPKETVDRINELVNSGRFSKR